MEFRKLSGINYTFPGRSLLRDMRKSPILAFGTVVALRSRFMRPLGAVSIAATLRG